MDELAGGSQRARRADVDLRAACRLVAPQGRRLSRLPRTRARAGGLRAGLGFHACGTDARHRASLLWVLGLPDDGLLRSDCPLRYSAGLDVLRRSFARPWHRRDFGLGALAFSGG